MQAYTEVVPPTAVTHAVSFPFINSRSQNLIVAKTSLLQIFETKVVRNVETTDTTDASPTLLESGKSNGFSHASLPQDLQTKLVLVGEFPLSGAITSLAAVKALNTKTGGEALLISFKSAKISLVEWDPDLHSLSTISIHYYEGDDLQGSPWTPDLFQCSSYLTVDPSSRCAALKFGVRNLAILPFRQLGDDLVMGDYDPDLDEAPSPQQANVTQTATGQSGETPYAASFVLPLTALDPAIIYPVDLAFLYEYREPAIGILSSERYPSSSLLAERKDQLTYTVFSLDLEQRARTPLLTAERLPFDLFKVVPLPLPVGGSLLIGCNSVVHVDEAGKTTAAAINEFSKQITNFAMADQSSLNLKLEGCVCHPLDKRTGDVLLILNTGEAVVLKFKLDGRSVSGLNLHRIPSERGGLLLSGQASSIAQIGTGKFFVGSEDADSIVFSTREKLPQLARKRSHAEMLGIEGEVSDEDIEDEDDLYGSDGQGTKRRASSLSAPGNSDEVTFSIQDRLPNLTPAGNALIGKSRRRETQPVETLPEIPVSEMDLVIPIGRGRSGGLAHLCRDVRLYSSKRVDAQEVGRAWSARLSSKIEQTTGPDEEAGDEQPGQNRAFDTVLITSTRPYAEQQGSAVYSITSDGIESRAASDFEYDALTNNVGTLNGGSRLVQVSSGDLRCYDQDFSLAQIMPMEDEATSTELKILHSSFYDPYLLVIRNDFSAIVLQADKSGDLDEVERTGEFAALKWKAGCIHQSDEINPTPLVYLLSNDGALHIFDTVALDAPVYIAEGLPFLPPLLSSESMARRSAARENLSELLVSDLGDSSHQSPHLAVRTKDNNITIYQPFKAPTLDKDASLAQTLRWMKVANHRNASSNLSLSTLDSADDTDASVTEGQRVPMHSIANVDGYNAIFLPGEPCALVLKEASSSVKILNLMDPSISFLNSIHCAQSLHGCLVVERSGATSTASMPPDTRFGDTGWAVREVKFDREVSAVAYHPQTGLYAVGTRDISSFKLPDDDWHQEWARESRLHQEWTTIRTKLNPADLPLKPVVDHDVIKLWDPVAGAVIHEVPMQEDESIMCLETLSLEVSEITHERKSLIVVGTSIIRGEDLPCNSSIYVFEIITVVPEPHRPETNKALKLIVREEVRGPVTAITEIGTEGFLAVAQGQKCMVRGLKEDNTLLPVAFMDMQCYATGFKALKGTGLLLVSDVKKGIWFTGYSMDPYRMRVFGKSKAQMEVLAAEFLPDDKQLFILAADPDCNIHVLEFNPEDPKSLSGQRLLQRSSFHAGHFITSMLLLPSTYTPNAARKTPSGLTNGHAYDHDDNDDDSDSPMPDAPSAPVQRYHVLTLSASGAVGLLTPLAEDAYRQLGALQTHLTSALEHPAGLNPRSFRAVESEGGARGVLDGNLLRRWWELGVQRRTEAATRVGAGVDEVMALLDGIAGGGLGYL